MDRIKILQLKIIAGLSVLFLIALACIAYLTILAHEKSIRNAARHSSNIISDSVYNGIIYPMSVGDNNTVMQQMASLKQSLKGGEIFIFGRNKAIAYASEKEKVGTDLMQQVQSAEVAAAIQQVLQRGKVFDRVYEERINGKPYLTVLRPILDESRCHQCHTTGEAIRGGLMVRQSMAGTYSNMANLQYKNMVTSLVGCLIAFLLLYFVIAKLVIKPVTRGMHGPDQRAFTARGDCK